ncbi:MAG TPA: hypothetical protein VKA46_43280 [Gemmataceae bacterium]|nr:hypothetical protein [Gemmataceae bacterium]
MRSQAKKPVVYLHHTRDGDGDVILFFIDPRVCPAGTHLQSSPVLGIRRSSSAIIDLRGDGQVGKYVIVTENSTYELQMPRAKAEHLARELGGALPS